LINVSLFWISVFWGQGFQSGPVPGTFTRLRSCIVPAEITEPPKKISSGQNHKYVSALFRSEFYTRMKRYWGENISIYCMRKLLFTILKVVIFKTGNIPSTWLWLNVSKWAGTRYFYPSGIVYSTGRNY
jgi:hypothetical protein